MKKSPGVDAKTTSNSVQNNEFVNLGMENWQRIRRNWLQVTSDAKRHKGEVKAKSIDAEDVIERVFSQSGNGVLREPVPLGQMIDILIDFWEADGLYD